MLTTNDGNQILPPIIAVLVLTLAFSAVADEPVQLANSAQSQLKWKELKPIPNSLGVAGPISGTDGNVLIVGGGANFPDRPPWEGGRKVWHDELFVLQEMEGDWKSAGKLPQPLGYAVTLSIPAGLVVQPAVACLGGSNSQKHFRECFLLRWDGKQVTQHLFPPLPLPCANASGVILNGSVYVAGGLESPTATSALHTFWKLDLHRNRLAWELVTPWPGPARMLAVMAILDEAIILASGAELRKGNGPTAERVYLRDCYRYHPSQGWSRLADLPRAAVAAPSPAISPSAQTLLVFGGDDGTQVDLPPQSHPGFAKVVLEYSSFTNTWKILDQTIPAAHVTTNIISWNGSYIVPSGEVRPGVRSPTVWQLR